MRNNTIKPLSKHNPISRALGARKGAPEQLGGALLSLRRAQEKLNDLFNNFPFFEGGLLKNREQLEQFCNLAGLMEKGMERLKSLSKYDQ